MYSYYFAMSSSACNVSPPLFCRWLNIFARSEFPSFIDCTKDQWASGLSGIAVLRWKTVDYELLILRTFALDVLGSSAFSQFASRENENTSELLVRWAVSGGFGGGISNERECRIGLGTISKLSSRSNFMLC